MKIGISKKIILLFILLVIILGAALGFYSLKHQKEIILLEFDERVKVLLSSLAVSSEYPVLIGNEKALDKIGKGILEQNDVVLCEIRNEEGKLLYKGGLKKGKYCREYTYPILTEVDTESTHEDLILGFKEKETKEIGKIYLVLSISSLIKKLDEMEKAMVVLVIFGIGFAFTFITILVRFILSRPISDLIRGIERISGGDLRYKVPVKSNDEIGKLAVSFNKMAEDLSRTLVSKDYVDNIIGSMVDNLIVTDPEGRVKTVNSATLDLLGYKEEEIIGKSAGILFEEKREDGKEEPPVDGTLLFESKTFKDLTENGVVSDFEVNCLTKNGKKIPAIFSGSVMRDKEGKIVNIVCVTKDITERKKAEEQIKASLNEKEVLLQEIHHRVKNNMQIISSLVKLQSRHITDNDALETFRSTQNRVKSMALIHERLYQSKDFARVDFDEYVRSLASNLFSAYTIAPGDIQVHVNIKDVFVDINTAIPCGLIINELVSNSLKHAFPNGKKGEINITMRPLNKDDVELIFSDNGVGLPENVDFRNTESLGLHLVTILAEDQLHGDIKLDRKGGTKYQMRLRVRK